MKRTECWAITTALFVVLFLSTASNAEDIDESQIAEEFSFPSGVSVDSAGNVYVTNQNNVIYKISPDADVTTFAGTAGTWGDTDGVGSATRFHRPGAITTDGIGNVYVADSGNSIVRKITPAGLVTTLGGDLGAWPGGVAVDSAGNVYATGITDNTIRKITPAGIATTLAGTAGVSGHEDGTGEAASFNFPAGIAIDSLDNLFVADSGNHTIRKITPAGVVTTLAGGAGKKGVANGKGTAARFNHPRSVAIDGARNVYVADSDNHTIRKISPTSVVTTLAGTAGVKGDSDGIGVTARFHQPHSVSIDSAGYIYVADTCNYAIRKITSKGVVTTWVEYKGGISCEDAGAD